MDSFSRSDRIRAVCAPLCCCFQRRLALSPSSDNLDPDLPERSWYTQSRPSAEPAATPGLPHSWGELAARDAQCEADLLSLHEGVGGGDFSVPRRRTARGRGGDISGGGANEGSGLTRWTLFKSWWRGGGGEIRLDDSDDEDGAPVAPADVTAPDTARVPRTDNEGPADGEALPLTFEDVAIPPAPPSGPAPPSDRDLDPPGLPTSPNVSEDITLVDDNEERRMRRARRHARRRARELGISLEEFEQGAASNPAELSASPFLDVHAIGYKAKRGSRSERSFASSTSSGSRSRRHDAAHEELFTVGEEHDTVDGGEATFASPRSGRRSRRDGHSSRRSATSGSQEGGTRHGSDAPSSSGSHSRRNIDSAAHRIPLPLSPRPGSHGPSSSTASSSRPSQHRSRPSTSTISTEASSRTSRRSKRRDLPAAEEHLSPLHHPAGSGGGEVQYFENEHGQLRAYYPEQATDYDEPSVQADYDPAVSPSTASWDHIGILPGAKAATLAPADEQEERDG